MNMMRRLAIFADVYILDFSFWITGTDFPRKTSLGLKLSP
nr:unnamed protein product [Callosobruchus analis]